jgi:hypothetical protein
MLFHLILTGMILVNAWCYAVVTVRSSDWVKLYLGKKNDTHVLGCK